MSCKSLALLCAELNPIPICIDRNEHIKYQVKKTGPEEIILKKLGKFNRLKAPDLKLLYRLIIDQLIFNLSS